MGELRAALVALLKVRSLMTLGIIAVMCTLALRGLLDTATFMATASAVVTYYFNRKAE